MLKPANESIDCTIRLPLLLNESDATIPMAIPGTYKILLEMVPGRPATPVRSVEVWLDADNQNGPLPGNAVKEDGEHIYIYQADVKLPIRPVQSAGTPQPHRIDVRLCSEPGNAESCIKLTYGVGTFAASISMPDPTTLGVSATFQIDADWPKCMTTLRFYVGNERVTQFRLNATEQLVEDLPTGYVTIDSARAIVRRPCKKESIFVEYADSDRGNRHLVHDAFGDRVAVGECLDYDRAGEPVDGYRRRFMVRQSRCDELGIEVERFELVDPGDDNVHNVRLTHHEATQNTVPWYEIGVEQQPELKLVYEATLRSKICPEVEPLVQKIELDASGPRRPRCWQVGNPYSLPQRWLRNAHRDYEVTENGDIKHLERPRWASNQVVSIPKRIWRRFRVSEGAKRGRGDCWLAVNGVPLTDRNGRPSRQARPQLRPNQILSFTFEGGSRRSGQRSRIYAGPWEVRTPPRREQVVNLAWVWRRRDGVHGRFVFSGWIGPLRLRAPEKTCHFRVEFTAGNPPKGKMISGIKMISGTVPADGNDTILCGQEPADGSIIVLGCGR